MKEHKSEEQSLDSLESVLNYIDVLVESYPEPISRTQLAEKAGVSKAAVTKVGDRLFGLCNPDALIFSRKLILRTDSIFIKILAVYFTKLRPARILKSRYGLAVLRKVGIHSKICEAFPEYFLYFDEYDTETMIKIILHNIDKLRIKDQIKATIEGIQNKLLSISMTYIENFGILIEQFDLPLENDADLAAILRIRDKGFLLTKHIMLKQIRNADILLQLSDTDREKYLDVYSTTVDYYLKKVLTSFTNYIASMAQKKGVDFKEDYQKIGSFYSKSMV